MTITNSTLQGTAPVFGSGTVSIYNSAVDGTVQGYLASAYNNVFKDAPSITNGAGNLINVADLGLGALTDNGGPVQTLAPQIGSALINVGDVAYLPLDTADADGDEDRTETLPISADGGVRLLDGGLEAGAVEFTLADAIDDAFSTDEATAIGVGLNLFDANTTTADSDPGDLLTITAVNGETVDVGTQVTLTSDAVLLVNGDGTFSYDPNGAFEALSGAGGANPQGTDSFTYTLNGTDTATVTITINGLNDAPAASGETLTATAEDTAITNAAADLLGNDSDVGGDTLTTASVTSGTGGTAALNGDGTVTFTPDANFNGAADFTYTVTDDTATTAAVTASLTVTAVNDAPSVTLSNVVTSLAEDANTSSRIKLADTVVTDDDFGDAVLGLSGEDAALFEIEGAELFLVAGTVLDFESDTAFEVSVTVDDPTFGSGIEDAVVLTLAITDVDDSQPLATPSADSIIGSAGADIINALGGDDTVIGGEGDDTLGGGSGNDLVVGENGNDSLGGGPGMDTLNGGSGNDTLGGGEDDDLISGGNGNDYLSANAGDDVIGGGVGNDFLDGSYGDDSLFGGQGNDSLVGGQGGDLLKGGSGDDWMAGGTGADTVSDFQDGLDVLTLEAGLRFSDLNIIDHGEGALITANGSSVLLIGMDVEHIDADDFLF